MSWFSTGEVTFSTGVTKESWHTVKAALASNNCPALILTCDLSSGIADTSTASAAPGSRALLTMRGAGASWSALHCSKKGLVSAPLTTKDGILIGIKTGDDSDGTITTGRRPSAMDDPGTATS
ncbi:hypothetical protein FKM82_015841 [Ascaphus truei]